MITAQIYGVFLSLCTVVLVMVLSSGLRRQTPAPDEDKTLTSIALRLFNNGDFPTALIDRNLQIRYASSSFSKIFMNGRAQCSIRPLLEIKPFSSLPELHEHIFNYGKTGILPAKPFVLGLNLSLCGKEWVLPPTHFILRSISTGNAGEEPMLGLSLIDSSFVTSSIDELTQRIAQKESNLKKLEELDRMKSEFLATLSHELKTPLVSIKGYLDLIATKKMGPLTEKQEKAVQVSLRNTSHLNNLISSILNFARMEAGKLKFDLVNQKIQSNINDIVDSLRPMADGRNISFEVEMDNSLPTVVNDPDLIHRVLSNLLENSIKFSPNNTVITIKAWQLNESQVKVEISDHGCGIPADKIDKIKAPFFQADKSDTRPTGGLGLGLAIAEKILTGHGTTLTIESEEGVGTTCSFVLKIAGPR